jgi:hypothetical protein
MRNAYEIGVKKRYEGSLLVGVEGRVITRKQILKKLLVKVLTGFNLHSTGFN